MSSTRDLLRKLNIFIKFQSIAKAIQMVAISGLKKLEKKISSRQLSLLAVKELFTIELDLNTSNFFISKNEIIILPITSDKQFCGIINKKVVESSLELFSLYKQKDHVSVFMVGSKGLKIMQKLESNIEFTGLCKDISSELVCLNTVYILFLKILSIKYDNLIIVFNKYFAIFSQQVAIYNLPSLNQFEYFLLQSRISIPVTISLLEKTKNSDFYYVDFFYYCNTLVLLDAFEENEYSELGTRAITMEGTLKNTKQLIEDLRITYNKLRQSKITTELIEIISASEAM